MRWYKAAIHHERGALERVGIRNAVRVVIRH